MMNICKMQLWSKMRSSTQKITLNRVVEVAKQPRWRSNVIFYVLINCFSFYFIYAFFCVTISTLWLLVFISTWLSTWKNKIQSRSTIEVAKQPRQRLLVTKFKCLLKNIQYFIFACIYLHGWLNAKCKLILRLQAIETWLNVNVRIFCFAFFLCRHFCGNRERDCLY